MAFTSFVSETFLKSFTPLNQNIDSNDLVSHLQAFELMNLQEILGRDLYNDLKTKFIDQTLSQIEIDLVNLMKNAIAYGAASMALPFMSLKLRNVGVTKLKGDNFDSADLADIKYLRNELDNRTQFFMQRIINFICLNRPDFPLYNWSLHNDPSPSAAQTTYNSEIWTGDDEEIRIARKYFGPYL
jgi:hypothetical protein